MMSRLAVEVALVRLQLSRPQPHVRPMSLQIQVLHLLTRLLGVQLQIQLDMVRPRTNRLYLHLAHQVQ